MAAALWGRVYYNKDLFAGVLRQDPSGRCVFTYDPAYLAAKHPAIAFTLPRQEAPHVCEAGLHPFFDNLVAEGWLRNAQARAEDRPQQPLRSPADLRPRLRGRRQRH